MYSAHRRILVDGCVGPGRTPTHGIPAGCPLAGELLALIAHMLVTALRTIGPRVLPRPYVDDLTTAVLGRADAAGQVGQVSNVIGRFGRVFRWGAAADNCARFSTDRSIRDKLAAAPGPPVKEAFTDQGVCHLTVGKSCHGLAQTRDIRALLKMSCMQAVSASFEWRCRLVAGSGLPTALYAAECTPVAAGRLRALRQAAYGVIWLGPIRAAKEIVFMVLAPWRADPMAITIVQPFRQLHRAIRAEACTVQQLDVLL